MKYKFPVYPLRSHFSITEESGFIFIETYYSRKIIDNKNIDSDYLVERRLSIPKKELYKLEYRCKDYSDILRVSKRFGYSKFIDRLGTIFTYKPTKKVRATWVQPTYDRSIDNKPFFIYNGTLIFVDALAPFLLVTNINGSYCVIDSSVEEPKQVNTWRKI